MWWPRREGRALTGAGGEAGGQAMAAMHARLEGAQLALEEQSDAHAAAVRVHEAELAASREREAEFSEQLEALKQQLVEAQGEVRACGHG